MRSPTITMTTADHILWLLRHVGPQSVVELTDSLGIGTAKVTDALTTLKDAGRAECRRVPRLGLRWIIIPLTTRS